ncbi:hypothetical protein EVAR_91205_1 [Eumeta japonica]|uniref:Uncharacterized protein n=1 Tax=Eumeta variegata TaxID=151549 RepID=A0A4C1ZM14_EUMVA|nr:hypothetical protein EVAR_91205_1 [Eumeta japonica]
MASRREVLFCPIGENLKRKSIGLIFLTTVKLISLFYLTLAGPVNVTLHFLVGHLPVYYTFNPSLGFDPSPVLNSDSGLAFDSDPGPVLDYVLYPAFNSDSAHFSVAAPHS